MTDTSAPQALVSEPTGGLERPQPMIVRVAREHGVSPFQQLIEAAKLRFGAPKLASNEYYDMGVFHPTLSKAEKQQFVGETRNKALNLSLSPQGVATMNHQLEDKFACSALLRSHGLSAPQTQAVFSTGRSDDGVAKLGTAAEITEFLSNTARYPLFGKPAKGSRSVGAALFVSVDPAADQLVLGNGRQVGLASTVREITEKFSEGYLFQSAIVQHEAMTKVAGPALGTLRIVTVADEGQTRPLYALWKLPAPDAMSDNFWQDGSMMAELDLSTGRVTQVHRGKGIDRARIETHPQTGMTLTGFEIPHFVAATAHAQAAHALAMGNGVLGFDIGISENGPVIVECNTNPFHTLYQLATGRGILNEQFAPVFDRIAKAQAGRAAG